MSESRERTFDQDVRTVAELELILERLVGRALRGARAPGPARPHGRHQDPARRLLDAHTGADAAGCRQRHRRRRPRGARAAAGLCTATTGASARRAGRRPQHRRGRGRAADAGASERVSSVERGRQAAARRAGEFALDAELVEHADDNLADLVAGGPRPWRSRRSAGRARARWRRSRAPRRRPRGRACRRARARSARACRRRRSCRKRSRGSPSPGRVRRGPAAAARAAPQRRRGSARARARVAARARRPGRRVRRPQRERARRGTASTACGGCAPANSATTSPSLKALTAGIPWMLKSRARFWLLSVSTLTSSTLPARCCDGLLEHRSELAAGGAPLGPEVDDHRHLLGALDDGGCECLLGDVHISIDPRVPDVATAGTSEFTRANTGA